MRKLILTAAAILFIAQNSFSQNLNSSVHPLYQFPVTRQQLSEAQTMIDIKPGYAKNWVTEYISSQISASCNGNILKAMGTNDTLSPEQKKLFALADIGWDITVEIKYKLPNPVTHRLENSTMNFFVTLVADSITSLPVADAEYLSGKEQMRKYLNENAISQISKQTSKEFQKGRVKFSVNEAGEITNCKISQSSGNPETDLLLLDCIRKMGNWQPAKNLKGEAVKQDFEFTVGEGGC